MIIPRLFTDRQRVSIFFKYDLNSTIVSRSNDNDVFVTSSMRSIFKLTRNSFYQKRSFYNLFPLAELLRNGPGRQNEPILLSIMAFSRNDIARYLFVVCVDFIAVFLDLFEKKMGSIPYLIGLICTVFDSKQTFP